jgi:hypothetical protein
MTAVQRQDDQNRDFATVQRELLALQRTVRGTAFTGMKLGTNWASYGAGWTPAGWAKDSGSFVHLRGLVKSVGSVTYGVGSTSLIGTLEQGPAESEMFTCFGYDSNSGNLCVFRVDVYATGLVYVVSRAPFFSVGTVTYLTLSGISFRAS